MSTATTYLSITPRDPIVARDGRPFGVGQGRRMRTAGWPSPQMAAGSFRTLLGKLEGEWDPEALLKVAFRGPLPVRDEKVIYFPSPADMVIAPGGHAMKSRPKATEGVSNLPGTGLRPCALETTDDDFKPETKPAFLSSMDMETWLLDAALQLSDEALECKVAPKEELRTHLRVEAESFAAAEGMLFTTAGLAFQEDVTMTCAVEADEHYRKHVTQLHALHPLGGERRLAGWASKLAHAALWTCPQKIREALTPETKYVRMTLATPAVWSGGWKPEWATAEGGTLPGTDLELKLIGACVDRWKPISGYSLVAVPNTDIKRGPKAVRWMAPAGSTYFFQVMKGSAAVLAEQWLKPITDSNEATQYARDGLGLAIWGIWRTNDGK
ncbi:MAG: type III-B CRISPR module-associated protein Cmr3 [Bryobacterales bacterium]|nr:type III-B CRISPR module-associated protein Cmr3 [Bryobacterales bacterium]